MKENADYFYRFELSRIQHKKGVDRFNFIMNNGWYTDFDAAVPLDSYVWNQSSSGKRKVRKIDLYKNKFNLNGMIFYDKDGSEITRLGKIEGNVVVNEIEEDEKVIGFRYQFRDKLVYKPVYANF